jgi:hypothetical protein
VRQGEREERESEERESEERERRSASDDLATSKRMSRTKSFLALSPSFFSLLSLSLQPLSL